MATLGFPIDKLAQHGRLQASTSEPFREEVIQDKRLRKGRSDKEERKERQRGEEGATKKNTATYPVHKGQCSMTMKMSILDPTFVGGAISESYVFHSHVVYGADQVRHQLLSKMKE